MLVSTSTQKHVVVGVSAMLGYQAIVSLYKRVRDGYDDTGADDASEAKRWVCPGIGALGAAVAAGLACRVVHGTNSDSLSAPPRQVSDFRDLLPRAVHLDPSHIGDN